MLFVHSWICTVISNTMNVLLDTWYNWLPLLAAIMKQNHFKITPQACCFSIVLLTTKNTSFVLKSCLELLSGLLSKLLSPSYYWSYYWSQMQYNIPKIYEVILYVFVILFYYCCLFFPLLPLLSLAVCFRHVFVFSVTLALQNQPLCHNTRNSILLYFSFILNSLNFIIRSNRIKFFPSAILFTFA